MRQFDFYEFAAVLAPGTVLLFGVSLVSRPVQGVLHGGSMSVGDLGVFVVLAYVAGQLLQAFGNGLEWVWWAAWGGWPTDWPRADRGGLLHPAQRHKLGSKLRVMLGLERNQHPFELPQKEWRAAISEAESAVHAAGRGRRLETFNGSYGLHRGIAAAFSSLLVLVLIVEGVAHWQVVALLAGCAGIGLYRMHRFGKRYARELFLQFLALPGIDQKEES